MIRLRSGVCCALGASVLLACGPAEEPPAVAAPPAPPERPAITEPDRTDVRLSPDGAWLAFRPPGHAPGLWLAPVGDLAAARPFVEPESEPEAPDEPGEADRAVAVLEFRWAYTGRELLYLSASGVERQPRLHAVDAETGEVRPLTPAGRAARLVHLSPSRPNVAVVELAAEQESEPAAGPGARGDLYRLDLGSGALELVAPNDGFAAWGFDDDLDLRLAFAEAADGLRVSQRAETGEWVDYSWIPADQSARTRFLGFDSDADVAYFLDGRGRDHVALVGAHVISGRAEVLFQDAEADVNDVVFHPSTRHPQAAAAGRHGQRWLVLDEAVRQDLSRLEGFAEGDLEIVDRALDDRHWLVAVVPWGAPRRFYLYDRETGETELLFGGRPELLAAAGTPGAGAEPGADSATPHP